MEQPHPGPIPPSDFIAAAERLGLVNKLTLVLFKKTLEDAICCPATLEWPSTCPRKT